MSKWTFFLSAMILGMLTGLFLLARHGDPLAIVVLSVLGTVVIMAVAFALVWLLQTREERRFRANAEENAGIMQAQARTQAQLGLAQQRLVGSMNMALPEPEPAYNFGLAPEALVGFDEVIEGEVIR